MKYCSLLLFALLFNLWCFGNSQTTKDTIPATETVLYQLNDSTSNSESVHVNDISKEVSEMTPFDDYMALDENTIETISVIANDVGIKDGVRSVVVIENPLHGKVEILQDFSAKYTPDRSYFGSDMFKYEVCNNGNECGTAKVGITVYDINYQPNTMNDTVAVRYFNNVNIDILSNDIDIYDEPLTVTIIKNTENNDCEINSDNELHYHPHRGFWGTDSLTYQVCDKEVNCSTATVYINVAEWTKDDLVIVNGMSPNGDGKNDTFFIPEFTGLENIELNIFNSWGSLIFETKNYQNNWDGIANTGLSKGKLVSKGTYYYLIRIAGEQNGLTGFVYVTY
jgi:gliding motility-associated-like protein